MYENFVRENANSIASIEGGLRSVSYLLPGRFKDSEVASESVFAAVKLIGLYHDSVLTSEAMRQNPKAPTLFNRYTNALLSRSLLYRKIAILMTLVQSFEVVAEMLAFKRFGAKAKDRLCLSIELVKFICRIALFKLSGNRMLQKSALPERDYDLAKLEPSGDLQGSGNWIGKRSGKEYVSVDSLLDSDKAMQFMLSKALLESSIDPICLASRLQGARLVGEYIFIARPILYLFAIRRYGSSDYKPWVFSLILEITAYMSAFDPVKGSFGVDLTMLDNQVLSERSYQFLYYLLREPLYSSFTRAQIQGWASWTSTKPLISIIGSVLNDYTPLWETYHFYTSP